MAKENKVLSRSSTKKETSSVGELLRAYRMRRRESIQDVSNILKIRSQYLIEIEKDNYQNLPGKIYATGFIRSYGDYLGLDSEELIERLKTDRSNLYEKTRLKFPLSVPEKSLPSKGMFLVGIFVCTIAYAGWDEFYSPRQDLSLEVLPIVNGPENKKPINSSAIEKQDLVLVKEKKKLALAAVQKRPISNVSENPDVALKPAEINAGGQNEKSLSEGPDTVSSSSGIQSQENVLPNRVQSSSNPPNLNSADKPSIIVEQQKDEVLSADLSSVVEPNQQPLTKTQLVSNAQVKDENKSKFNNMVGIQSESTSSQNGDAPSKLIEINSPVETGNITISIKNRDSKITLKKKENPSYNRVVYPGSQPRQSNNRKSVELDTPTIILTAKNASWIQIRDTISNELIVSRVLPKNHTYKIPDRRGLSLMTGNAGALEISVGGVTIPPMGKRGELRHTVLLDAEKLRNGTAVIE